MTVWTPERVAEMERLARQGLGQKAVARALGAYPKAVKCAASRYGVHFRKIHRELRKVDHLGAAYVDRGLSIIDLSKQIQRHPKTISRWLKAAGVKVREPGYHVRGQA